jgi:hypothetical protein
VVAISLLLIAPAAHAQLELRSIRLPFGVTWPERQPREFVTDDRVSFHYVVDGVGRGSHDLDCCAVRITNATGSTVLECPNALPPHFGSHTGFWGEFVVVSLNDQVPPGRYTLTVHVRDPFYGEGVTFHRPIIIRPTRLDVRLFDASDNTEGTAPFDETLLTRAISLAGPP